MRGSSVGATTTDWLSPPSRSAFLKYCGPRSGAVQVMRAATCDSCPMSLDAVRTAREMPHVDEGGGAFCV